MCRPVSSWPSIVSFVNRLSVNRVSHSFNFISNKFFVFGFHRKKKNHLNFILFCNSILPVYLCAFPLHNNVWMYSFHRIPTTMIHSMKSKESKWFLFWFLFFGQIFEIIFFSMLPTLCLVSFVMMLFLWITKLKQLGVNSW